MVPGGNRASRKGCEGVEARAVFPGRSPKLGVRSDALVSVTRRDALGIASPHTLQKRLSSGIRLEQDGHRIMQSTIPTIQRDRKRLPLGNPGTFLLLPSSSARHQAGIS